MASAQAHEACGDAQRELETWPLMRWSTVWCSRCVIIPLTLVC